MNTSSSNPFADASDTWNQRFAGEAYIFGTEPNACRVIGLDQRERGEVRQVEAALETALPKHAAWPPKKACRSTT